MSEDVIHRWEPSERLKRLAARQAELSDDQVSAYQWIYSNATRFVSKQRATAIANLVGRHFGRKLALTGLRKKVARSRIEGGMVKGDLQGLRGLGTGTLGELRHALEECATGQEVDSARPPHRERAFRLVLPGSRK